MRTSFFVLVVIAIAGCTCPVQKGAPPLAGGTPTSLPTVALPAQGSPCANGACAAGLKCVEYTGDVGPGGPTLTSCEIPCAHGEACPLGQTCTMINDGPGEVCRGR